MVDLNTGAAGVWPALGPEGRPAAVLIAVGDDEEELERLLLASSPKFQTVLRQAREQLRATGGIRHDDFWGSVDEGET